jgi:F-type H+-transporting ATPase subunit delta
LSISRNDAHAIASRYATAIFALSEEAGVSDAVSGELLALAKAVKDSPALAQMLKNPLAGRDAKSGVLVLLAKKGHELTRKTLETLAEQGRAELLPDIAEALAERVAAERGIVTAEVTSARPLAPAIEKQIAEALKAATGKDITMNLKQDPALLGGVSIRMGSLLLDATLQAALNDMRNKLHNA